MDEFVKATAPLLAANLLTVALIHSYLRYDRNRQSGLHTTGARFAHLVVLVLCLSIVAYGLSLYGTFGVSPFSDFVG
jgi:hypothetical protein